MLDRFDYIFSIWIFVWYIVYQLNLVSYNPKGILFLALIENMIGIMIMVYYSYIYILDFCITIFFIKIIPLWTLRNSTYTVKDMYATLILFCVYLGWIYLNHINLLDILQHQIRNIQENKPIGPIYYFLKRYYLN